MPRELARQKPQLAHRCALPLIHRVLAAFRAEELKAQPAAQRLGLSRAQFYRLYADYLRACAHHRQSLWKPGTSGGNHAPQWPPEVLTLLHKRLRVQPRPGTTLILCHHPYGNHSILASQPHPNTKPVILFTNLPK